jgi:hypothetical protein
MRRNWASIVRTATMQLASVEEACQLLQRQASVEVLDFDGALLRAGELLGLEELRARREAA